MKADRPKYCFRSCFKTGLRENPPGFTLMELVVGIAIIVILTVAAIPAVNGYMSRHALQYATDELYGDIQLARLRAARQNRPCRIVFNFPAANQYTLMDVGNNGLIIGTIKTVDLGKFRDNITFCLSPDATNPPPYGTLQFLSQGVVDAIVTLPANSDSVYLTNQANDIFYRVLVSTAGGTSVDRWNTNLNQWR